MFPLIPPSLPIDTLKNCRLKKDDTLFREFMNTVVSDYCLEDLNALISGNQCYTTQIRSARPGFHTTPRSGGTAVFPSPAPSTGHLIPPVIPAGLVTDPHCSPVADCPGKNRTNRKCSVTLFLKIGSDRFHISPLQNPPPGKSDTGREIRFGAGIS